MSANEPPISIMLSGPRVALGPLRDDLVEFYNDVRNDLSLQKFTGSPLQPVPLERTKKHLEGRAEAGSETASFTVYRHDTWEPIGTTNLFNIDHWQQTAEFGIGFHRRHINQGYGTETAQLLLAYAFQMLNLHMLYLSVDGANPRGKRAYEKAGYREAGRYREAIVVDRRRYDLIHMDCLASEFEIPAWVIWGPPE